MTCKRTILYDSTYLCSPCCLGYDIYIHITYGFAAAILLNDGLYSSALIWRVSETVTLGSP